MVRHGARVSVGGGSYFWCSMAEVSQENGKTYIDIKRGDVEKGTRIHSAGKGDQPRPINKKRYDENFDKIDWSK